MENQSIVESAKNSKENAQVDKVGEAFLLRKARSLCVTNLPSNLKLPELTSYFSKYGTVQKCFYVRKRRAIVTFTSREGLLSAMETHHSIYGQDVKTEPMTPRSSDSRGQGGVFRSRKPYIRKSQWTYFDPHRKIMDQLEKCETVSSQIQTFCDVVSLTKNDVTSREEVLKDIENVLRKYYPQCSLQIFGSSAIGFATSKSSLDIFFEPVPTYSVVCQNRQPISRESDGVALPNITDLEKGTVSQDSLRELSPHCHVRLIRQIFGNHVDQFWSFVLAGSAAHIKFNHKKTGIDCVLKCGTRSYLYSTEMLKLYAALDERFLPLMKVLRYWARFRGVIQLHSVSSYCFSLLVVFFLQNTNPPILPSIDKLKSIPAPRGSEWEYGFCNDVKKIVKTKNTQAVETLISEFFGFYKKLEYTDIICPFTGQKKTLSAPESVPPEQRLLPNALHIENPFNPMQYTVPYVRLRLRTVKHAMGKAHEVFHPNSKPSEDVWGLMHLYESQRDIYEVPMKYFPKTKDTVSFSLELSRKLQSLFTKDPPTFFKRLGSLILQTFEDCLLFESEVIDMLEMVPHSEKAGEQPPPTQAPWTETDAMDASTSVDEDFGHRTSQAIESGALFSPGVKNFKPVRVVLVQSTAVHDTWSKRRHARLSKLGISKSCQDLFTVEHAKSEWLVTRGFAKLGVPVFFTCDCYVYRMENKDQLLFFLAPYKGSNSFLQGGFFLKGLILRVLNKLLSGEKPADGESLQEDNDGLYEESMDSESVEAVP